MSTTLIGLVGAILAVPAGMWLGWLAAHLQSTTIER